MSERLDRLVSARALLTRSEAAAAIRHGRVSVDGEIRCNGSERTDTDARILLDGEPIRRETFIYIMMNKPEGVLSATEDKRGEKTALDLLPDRYKRRALGVVGRLDKDAKGLLLLTDDGVLNHRLTSPKTHQPKLYEVKTDLPATAAHAEIFAAGMDLGNFTARGALLEPDGQRSLVTISEGKFHQVKRMFEKVGLRVLSLKRLRIGSLCLDENLPEGGFRELSDEELQKLRDHFSTLPKKIIERSK